MTELDLIKTISKNTSIIDEFSIDRSLFYSSTATELFDELVVAKHKGYSDYDIKMLDANKTIKDKNLEGAINDILEQNLNSRIYDFAKNISSYVDENEYKSTEVISAIKDRVSNLENIKQTSEDVLTTDDFDDVFENILSDDYTAMSEAITEEFEKFDELTGGLVEDTTWMLAGSSGRGKTAFALNVALNASMSKHFKENDLYSLYFNYEMNPKRFYMRCIMKLARVSKEDLKNKTDEIKKKLYVGHKMFKELNLLVTHDTPKTISDTKYMIRRYCNQHKVRLIVIDYIGRMIKDSDERQKQEHQLLRDWVIELSNVRRETSRKYTEGAKAIPFTLFILSQLNRTAEEEGQADARKHMQGSYSMISELDYLFSIDYMKKYGFVLKNNKARDEEDGFWINFKFEKQYQNFEEVGVIDKNEAENNIDELEDF